MSLLFKKIFNFKWWEVFFNNFYTPSSTTLLFFLGISSGIPVSLVTSTISLWLYTLGISKMTIGLLSFATLPYLIKFIWAPLLDKLAWPYFTNKFGKRKGIILITQIILIVSILVLGFINPIKNIVLTFLLIFIIAFFSASQEVVIDSYRIELLSFKDQSTGAVMSVLGYKIGALLGYSLTPIIADYACYSLGLCSDNKNWILSFSILASYMSLALLTLIFLPEQRSLPHKRINTSIWQHYFIEPLISFTNHKYWFITILFIITYKISNQFIISMLNIFWLDIGFTLSQIAGAAKFVGFIAIAISSLLVPGLMHRLGLKKSFILAILLTAFTNYMLIIQYYLSNNIYWLYLTVTLGSIAGGLAGGFLITYINLLCKFSTNTATQYALLTSLSNSSKIILPTLAAYLATKIGWVNFFYISIALSSIPLVLLYFPFVKINKPYFSLYK